MPYSKTTKSKIVHKKATGSHRRSENRMRYSLYKNQRVMDAPHKGLKKFKRDYGNKVSTSNSAKATMKLKTVGKVTKVKPSFIKKVLDAASARNTYINQNALSVAANTGVCQYSFFDLNSNSDLSTINSYVIANNTGKYLLEDSHIDITMANMTTACQYGRLYEIVPRHDIPVSLGTYTQIYTNGLAEAGSSTTKIAGSSLDSKLFDSHLFCTYFKILKQREFTLDPGQNFKIEQSIGSKNVNMDVIQTANCTMQRNYGRLYVIQIWGGIVNDSVTKTNVSTDSTKVDFIYNRRYNYKYTQDLQVSTNITNNIPSIAVSPEYINPDTDTVMIDAQA